MPPQRHPPPIVLTTSDHDVLVGCVLATMLTEPRAAGALLDEVRRAQVVADASLAADVVRLGSVVTYLDHASGLRRQARLVPVEGNASEDLSATSSDGAALVGLRKGQSILWDDRVGRQRWLTVLDVQPMRGPAHAIALSAESKSRQDGGEE